MENVIIKKIIPTGKRFIPKDVIGKIGKIVYKNKTWTRVCFDEPKTFSSMFFGKRYFDFLDEELIEL